MNKRAVAAIKRNRTRRLASLLAKSAYHYRKKNYDKMANMVCDEFVDLGGVYVKFLQGVLLKSDLMKRWKNPNRLKIFENLDTELLDIASILRTELSKDKLAQIALVQPQPFAAGSFGQVYYGQHLDGTPIVIKVIRPMIGELLKHDLKLLSIFYRRFITKLYNNVDFNLDKAVSDFKNSTMRETDYVHEAEFANELYQVYKNHDKFFIPKTYLELCTPNVIVQEYVDGLSVAALVKLREQGVDPKQYVAETLGSDLDEQLKTLSHEAMLGVFHLPRVMGDPHPGNIRLMTNNRVGVIDFGISAKTPEDKSAFFGMLEAYAKIHNGSLDVASMFEKALQFFVGDLYKALKRIGQFVGEKTIGDVSKVASETFENITGTKILTTSPKEEVSLLSTVNKVLNKDNRFGFIIKLDDSEILRATQTFVTLVFSLGRTKQVMPEVLDRVIKEVGEEHPEYLQSSPQSTSLSDAIETVMEWLERVAQKDPELFQKLSEKVKGGHANVVKSNEEQHA